MAHDIDCYLSPEHRAAPGRGCPLAALAEALTGLIRAEGRVLSLGQRVGYSEARQADGQGRLLASATSTLLVFARKR